MLILPAPPPRADRATADSRAMAGAPHVVTVSMLCAMPAHPDYCCEAVGQMRPNTVHHFFGFLFSAKIPEKSYKIIK
jgi:hypothetical protein